MESFDEFYGSWAIMCYLKSQVFMLAIAHSIELEE